MLPLRARVINGRLVLNEPTTLPEGTEVELAFADDDLDDADRARLHEALDAADDELRAGKWISGTQLVASCAVDGASPAPRNASSASLRTCAQR